MAQLTKILTDSLGVLEEPCEECAASGRLGDDADGSFYPCAVCEGTGHTLTDTGQSVIAFLEHAITRIRFRSGPGCSL
jgi:hypothetical protein